jgi:serine/threonine protein kinase
MVVARPAARAKFEVEVTRTTHFNKGNLVMNDETELNTDRAAGASQDDVAIKVQSSHASLRTTLPEFMPGMATTVPEQCDGTDVRLASGDPSAPQAISHGSFAGELGRFNYVRTLGEGAFGIVVQAWDPELHAHRAIKMPHRTLLESRKVDAESYVREARKLALLGKHPNIVDVLDIQRMSDGTPFVVSEFIPGGNLADKLSRGRLPWREAVSLIADIADAIMYAHSKGVVHRDLKPANILLSEDGKPVIVDFGLALGDDEFSYHSSVCGTYQYMSPQQVRGHADRVDGRSDIYSLGVILYQMVAGRLPYRSRDVKSLKREIVENEPAPLRQYNPDAPEALENICQRAMAKEPGDRYTTAADFAQELRHLLKPQASSARDGLGDEAAQTHPPATYDSAVRRWLPIGLAVFGAAILAVGAYSLIAPSRSAGPQSALAAPATPNLQIHFQKKDSHTYSPRLADADLPIRVGDKLQFHVDRLPRPMYAYIYRIDADGAADRLWPEKDSALAQQKPVNELSSPPKDDEWWAVEQTGGELVFLLGVSEKPLNEQQLRAFESQTSMTRASLLEAMRRARQPIAEFEFPAQTTKYEIRNNELYRTRGGDLHLVVSPKAYASDHSNLKNWFVAYHGWIVAAK